MQITIYQAKEPTFVVEKKKATYDKSEYNNVYGFNYDYPATKPKIIDILEYVFERFNIARPIDFKGHSLSVSDIIEISEGIFTETYICLDCGWKKILWEEQ